MGPTPQRNERSMEARRLIEKIRRGDYKDTPEEPTPEAPMPLDFNPDDIPTKVEPVEPIPTRATLPDLDEPRSMGQKWNDLPVWARVVLSLAPVLIPALATAAVQIIQALQR